MLYLMSANSLWVLAHHWEEIHGVVTPGSVTNPPKSRLCPTTADSNHSRRSPNLKLQDLVHWTQTWFMVITPSLTEPIGTPGIEL